MAAKARQVLISRFSRRHIDLCRMVFQLYASSFGILRQRILTTIPFSTVISKYDARAHSSPLLPESNADSRTQIASRLWHQPIGILIDATSYHGRNDPQDELFKALELLTPTELARNLKRIYVYNMNSAYK